jgi:hypothetical protein
LQAPKHCGVTHSYRKPHLGFLSERADQVMLSQHELAFQLKIRPLAKAVAAPRDVLQEDAMIGVVSGSVARKAGL